jgi:hypothetical protein
MPPRKIPPFRLVPKPLDVEAANLPKFAWADPEIGTRHRLGGKPDFIQGELKPDCPFCRTQMTFYAQLDSINDDIIIADCGMIYVFVCFDCYHTEARVQSY